MSWIPALWRDEVERPPQIRKLRPRGIIPPPPPVPEMPRMSVKEARVLQVGVPAGWVLALREVRR